MIGKKVKANSKAKPVSVLVCTDKRGVFFGETLDVTARPLRMTGLRMCLTWSAATGGFTGLAERGPDINCAISATIPGESLVEGVTFVAEVTEAAAAAWRSAKVQGR